MRYRRVFQPGGTYFFTVVTHNRRPLFHDPVKVALLRDAFRRTRTLRPFVMEAIVVLPDHLHCLWRLPAHDDDFPTRWNMIKGLFSKSLRNHPWVEGLSSSNARRERRIWQRRYWEHLVRNENDWQQHLNYIHYNPVKHGLARSPIEWRYSSFMRFVEKGWYERDWGAQQPQGMSDLDLE